MSDIAPLKTEGEFEFWLNGKIEPITGRITAFEFVEVDDEVTTFLEIQSGTKKYRVPLKEVKFFAEETGPKAA